MRECLYIVCLYRTKSWTPWSQPPTPLTRGIVFYPLKERGRGGGAPPPPYPPPSLTLLVTLVTPHVNDLAPPLSSPLPLRSLATVQRNNSSTVNKSYCLPVNILYHLFDSYISAYNTFDKNTGAAYFYTVLSDLVSPILLLVLAFLFSLRVLCRWFRFAQLAKGKKSRP